MLSILVVEAKYLSSHRGLLPPCLAASVLYVLLPMLI